MTRNRKCHVVPPDEQRCVWMTAGILSYQLCDRMLECDSCPLDQAIRRQFLRSGTAGTVLENTPEPPVPKDQESLRHEFRYSRNHCWIRERDDSIVLVGIEPGLSTTLLSPKAIVFPSRGQVLRTGQTCLWIVMEGGTLPLECPMDGRVIGINTALEQRPHLLNEEPFDQAWLYELQPSSSVSQVTHLMEVEEARRKYAADHHRLMTMLSAAIHGNRSSIGLTLADGGQRLQNIADMLGPSRYFSLVRQAFG